MSHSCVAEIQSVSDRIVNLKWINALHSWCRNCAVICNFNHLLHFRKNFSLSWLLQSFSTQRFVSQPTHEGQHGDLGKSGNQVIDIQIAETYSDHRLTLVRSKSCLKSYSTRYMNLPSKLHQLGWQSMELTDLRAACKWTKSHVSNDTAISAQQRQNCFVTPTHSRDADEALLIAGTTFAISYYTNARFFSSTDRATQAWIASLTLDHMKLICGLRFYDPAVDATSLTMMQLDERLFRMAKSKEYLCWTDSDWHHVAKFFVRFRHGTEYTWLSSEEVCDACCGINFKHRQRSADDWLRDTRSTPTKSDL